MELIDRVLFPLTSRQNYPSLFDYIVSFRFLQSCHLFSPLDLAVLAGLLRLGPGSCTLHSHTLVITPSVNNHPQVPFREGTAKCVEIPSYRTHPCLHTSQTYSVFLMQPTPGKILDWWEMKRERRFMKY